MSYLLGVDIGTTGLKAGVFDEEGNSIASTRVGYKIVYPKPGWAEISPDEWWGAFIRSLSSIWGEGKITGPNITAIGISTLCPALVPIDKGGSALRPAIPYFDQRSAEQVAALLARVSPGVIARLAGNRMASGAFSASSMLWLRDCEGSLYKNAAILGHVNTFIAYKLTGRFGIDYTNASFTGLFDLVKRDWSGELCSLMDISRDKLPPILPSDGIVGRVTREASQVTGLREGTPVAIGAADTACSALALGVVDEGQTFESCGASEVLTICWDHPHFDNRFLNRCHVVPDRYLSHGAMSTAGSAVEWFRSLIYPERAYEEMTRDVQGSPPGAKGVIFVPYLMGERTPIWDPNARGIFWGLSLSTTRGDMSRAVLEGVAYGLAQMLEMAEESMGSSNPRIISVGGGARNALWNQIKADVTGKVILRSVKENTALLGASMIAAVASGIFRDYREAITHMAHTEVEAFYPREEFREVYRGNYELYKRLSAEVRRIGGTSTDA